MAKKERPRCDVCGVTHWAGEPHRIDPAIAADIIKKLELRIVELQNQLAAREPVPDVAITSAEIAPQSCFSTASYCFPQGPAVPEQQRMQLNALNYLLQTGGLRQG